MEYLLGTQPVAGRKFREWNPEMKFFTKAQALVNSMRKEEEGATAVEYGLMVSLIAIAAIVGITAVGTALQALFTDVSGRL